MKEWSESESGVPDRWSVFSPEGRWLGVVDGLSRCYAPDILCWIGSGFFLMVTHDDHGAERVEVYAIRKAQGP